MEVVGVEELEAEEGKNDLQRERAAIHKVTVEQLNSVVKHYDAQVLDLWHLDVVSLEVGMAQTRKTALNTKKVPITPSPHHSPNTSKILHW